MTQDGAWKAGGMKLARTSGPGAVCEAPPRVRPHGRFPASSNRTSRRVQTGHIPALDGVRGLAVLLVLLFHGNLIRYVDEEGSWVDEAFVKVAESCWLGVDLFFVLSGFLITGILYEAKGQARYLRNFYLRRSVRIFPLYYSVLIFSLVILPNLPTGWVPAEKVDRFLKVEGDELWFWLYLSNFATASYGEWRHGILDVTWSLCIEEHYYLVWPWVVLALGRRRLMKVCAVLFVVAFGIRLAMTLGGATPIATYVVTPARMDLLAAGSWVALAVRGEVGVRGLWPAANHAWLGSALVMVMICALQGGFRNMDPVVQTLGFSAIGIHFGSLLIIILAAEPRGWISRVFSSPVLRTLGKYSYAMYLFHLPLRALIRDTLYGRDQFLQLGGSMLLGQLIFYLLLSVLTLACAMVSWNLMEKHFLKLKRYAR